MIRLNFNDFNIDNDRGFSAQPCSGPRRTVARCCDCTTKLWTGNWQVLDTISSTDEPRAKISSGYKQRYPTHSTHSDKYIQTKWTMHRK